MQYDDVYLKTFTAKQVQSTSEKSIKVMMGSLFFGQKEDQHLFLVKMIN